MNVERWVGSTAIRLVTGALALACLGGIALHREQVFPGAGGWVLGVSIAVGVLALMAAVHCSRGVYARWLAFSERLHTGVVTALFGACYLVLVPVFRVIGLARDPLHLHGRDKTASFWIPRRQDSDPSSLERMG